ncbi:MAG: hypothetical protein GF398_03345 [Chitinivibrionales bacterium]|nr:hypothetical protein [Chitinivibrionales bacterium]
MNNRISNISTRMRHPVLMLFVLLISFVRAQSSPLTALLQNDPKKRAEAGMWLCHYPSNTVDHIYEKMIQHASFAPDGKRIVFTQGNEMFTINNDGTDRISVLSDNTLGSTSKLYWTTNGVFWLDDNKIHRLIVDTKTHSTVYDLNDAGEICDPSDIFSASSDGKRMWIAAYIYPAGSGEYNCTNPATPYFIWNDDFTNAQIAYHRRVGPGIMTGSGHVYQRISHYNHDMYLTRQNSGSSVQVLDTNLQFPFAFDHARNRGLCNAVNNPDLIGVAAFEDNNGSNRHLYFVNRTSHQISGEFPWPCDPCDRVDYASLWDGALPDPHDNRPYIIVDSTFMTFDLVTDHNEFTRTATVTNHGTASLAKLTTSADVDWLVPKVNGNGGDEQTITYALDLSILNDWRATAHVTISGGGAYNSILCTLKVKMSTDMPTPTDLQVTTSGTTAQLTWQDNAGSEKGYIIQKYMWGGTYTEIGRVDANVVTFTDNSFNPDSATWYRVNAYALNQHGKEVYSDYSYEVSLGTPVNNHPTPLQETHRVSPHSIRITAQPGGYALHFAAPATLHVEMFDVRGKLLYQTRHNFASGTPLYITASRTTPYLLRLTRDNDVRSAGRIIRVAP